MQKAGMLSRLFLFVLAIDAAMPNNILRSTWCSSCIRYRKFCVIRSFVRNILFGLYGYIGDSSGAKAARRQR
ncbi:hypothetical protein SAMN04488090_3481 [Siphonobacter aquaeclarae]|uniref:Secreted protein n=1 Tax=Siphonobacter aquaeclarae TaxID=563176 RepID=A0A1G9TAF8_9BACT|nr:hypothetical protein SAMN04488090_3481 [Siphonobacter aquaeclarae]